MSQLFVSRSGIVCSGDAAHDQRRLDALYGSSGGKTQQPTQQPTFSPGTPNIRAGASTLSRMWQSLTGSSSADDYELQMPWNLPKPPAPTMIDMDGDDQLMVEPGVAMMANMNQQESAMEDNSI